MIWIAFRSFRPVIAAVLIVLVFSLVLQLFSYIYWAYGTRANFGMSLSHLDSLYFALGTLTTAGTGNLATISETARRIQTLQMVLDVGLVVVAVTLVLARYSGLFTLRAAPPGAGSTTPKPSEQGAEGAAHMRTTREDRQHRSEPDDLADPKGH